jgi:hypothetical protein
MGNAEREKWEEEEEEERSSGGCVSECRLGIAGCTYDRLGHRITWQGVIIEKIETQLFGPTVDGTASSELFIIIPAQVR